MYRILITCLTFLIALLLPVAPVAAQVNYPGVIVRLTGATDRYTDVQVNVGESYTGSFTVQHAYAQADKQVELYVYASNFVYNRTKDTVIYPAAPLHSLHEFVLADWMSFDRERVVLDHVGQEEAVYFTVRVPPGTSPGTYYANVLLSDHPAEIVPSQEQITISRLVATTVLVTVPGDVEQLVSLHNVKVAASPTAGYVFSDIFAADPISFEFAVNNTSSRSLLPGGDFFIYTSDITQPLYTGELNPTNIRVLPNSERTLTVKWDSPGAKLGYYNAQFNLLYRDSQGELILVPYTINFWILPLKLIGISAGLLIIGVAAYFFFKRRRVR